MERKVWGFSFWDDKNVLELDKGYGYITKHHQTVHFKMVSFMMSIFYLINKRMLEQNS